MDIDLLAPLYAVGWAIVVMTLLVFLGYRLWRRSSSSAHGEAAPESP